MTDEMYPDDPLSSLAYLLAIRLRSEVKQLTEITDADDDFGWGYIAGLKRALLLLREEVDR